MSSIINGTTSDGVDIERLVPEVFPPVTFAMAYGSGVFAQKSTAAAAEGLATTMETKATAPEKKKTRNGPAPMIDMVFVVDEPAAWHSLNMRTNPTHYSPFARAYPSIVPGVQDNYGAHIYYNTLVPIPDDFVEEEETEEDAPPGASSREVLMKYGVISKDRLAEDLNNWTTLYIAGRMQKPVRRLGGGCPPELEEAFQANLAHALRASILLLPERFTERELYMTICGLSYLGDFRMGFAENPRKVENIVDKSFPLFRDLYRPVLDKLIATTPEFELAGGFGTEPFSTGAFEASPDAPDDPSRLALVAGLPRQLREAATGGGGGSGLSTATALRRTIGGIVRRTSMTQSLKGIFTAGVVKSAVYALQKLEKGAGRKLL